MGTVRRLTQSEAAALRRKHLTERSWTEDLAGESPAGYRVFARTRVLRGSTSLDRAGSELFAWGLHRRAGLHVAASEVTVAVDVDVQLELRLAFLRLYAPCRVTRVVVDGARRGFTYGTLDGHPESGFETFLLEQNRDGELSVTISGVSRPASLLARLSGPAATAVQTLITRRYSHALDGLDAGA